MRAPAVLAFLAAVPAGCASTVLVPAGDPTFRRAQERLARTTELVESTDASRAEKTLFLQAEGFYRYRFSPPARSPLTFVVQAAAVATDFPALQAVAGSIDLLALQVRTYDGAVHLWETLLAQRPDTPLRPFALYRLGWAYRSAGATGFPRESGDEALRLLLAEAPQGDLATWARDALDVSYKTKGAATAWSIVPGLGQIYVGETGSGIVRLAVALASAALVVVPSVLAIERGKDLTWGHDWPLLGTSLLGLILLSIDYTTAYEDALRGVVQFNERQEAAFEKAHPDAP